MPELAWYAGNQRLEGAVVERAESRTFVSSEISIRVDRSDNGKSYHCRAKNKAREKPFTRSVRLQGAVHISLLIVENSGVLYDLYAAVRFPPRRVEVEVSPSSPVVGSRASLRCWTDPSSPGTKLVTQHSTQVFTKAQQT